MIFMKLSTKTVAVHLAIVLLGSVSIFAFATNYTFFGDARLVSPGYNSPQAAELTSDAAGANYGGVNFSVPSTLTVADLDQLSTDYMFTSGTCGGGAPRFQIEVSNGTTTGNIFVYLGDPPNYTNCPQNVWINSGNLLDAADLVDATQIGGTFYQPYSSVQAAYGSYNVTGISLVTDGSFAVGTQVVRVDNVNVDGTVYTFENANSCKNGGYQQFTTSPGPFSNQGQCVSYFVRNSHN